MKSIIKLMIWSLHSTMFLLIQSSLAGQQEPYSIFTFHNVSINTNQYSILSPTLFALHSTMFLLIHGLLFPAGSSRLTLHSTMFLLILYSSGSYNGKIQIFTFHNVSINTEKCRKSSCGTDLYIPQCFY